MRRSASSEVEGSHLAACPNCGTLNGKTAARCWKCEIELAGPSMHEPAPLLRTSKTSSASVAPPDDEGPSLPEAQSPAYEPRDAAAREPAGSATEAGPIATSPQPAKPEAPPAVAPEDNAPAPGPEPFADSRSVAARTEAVRSKRRKVVSAATVVVGAVVAVSAYFVSRQHPVGDMTGLPAGSTEATGGRGSPTDVGSRVDANAGSNGRAPAASMPGPTATNAHAAGPPSPPFVERSVDAIDRDPPAAVGIAPGGEKAELRASSQSKATLAAGAARATTSKRGVSKRAMEPPEATAAPARSRTAPAGTLIEKPPPHPGPCTPAIAALGLCTPEPTQRRE